MPSVAKRNGENEMAVEKTYLGDGVYIRSDGYYTILTAENGIQVTATIYIEDQVAKNLIDYLTEQFGL
jgi:hypothetical protein